MHSTNSTTVPALIPAATRQARGVFRVLLLVAGWIALVLGAIGVILPLMPTAPFLLLALACFSRSSRAMEEWMYRLPLVGRYLRDWQEEGISPSMKWSALAALWITTFTTLILVAKTVVMKTIVLATAILVTLHFLLMPVRRSRRTSQHSP
ncbi:MAG: YbaN family protein [Proteobacteria bacterium]|nr:YbaN family protein [Pseudomonadota bacterium]